MSQSRKMNQAARLSLLVAPIYACTMQLASAQQDYVISPYGSQAYPAAPRPAGGAISPYGAQAYPMAPRPAGGAITQYGAQANGVTPTAGQQAALNAGGHVPQEASTYTLEAQGAWHRVEGMPASMPDPTQLAPGSYTAPPVPAGTVFGNSGQPPLNRPKSATPPKRFSDLYGTYPQNVVGTWKIESGGQFTQTLEGPDRNGMQKHEWGGPEAAGTMQIKADGTWTYTFAGKTQQGRWADAPDTVHLFGFAGEENFVYWNNLGQLQIQSKAGRLVTAIKA